MKYIKLLYRQITKDNLNYYEKRELYEFIDAIKLELYFYMIVVVLLLIVKFYA